MFVTRPIVGALAVSAFAQKATREQKAKLQLT